MDDGNQCFKKKISATCQIVMDGWQLMTLEWYHGCSYNGVA
jgi:hypothetical protein